MGESVQVSGRTTRVVVNSGPANLVVRGEGDPGGATLGEIAVESTDTVQVAATWTASARGYSATAGPASQLHCPTSRAKTQLGFLVAFRKGADTIPTSGPFIPYGNGGDYPLEVGDAGEEVTVRYTPNDVGLPPHFVVVPVADRAVSETTTIILSQANAAPDTAVTDAELNAIRARQTTDEQRIGALEKRPSGTGGQSASQVSAAISAALDDYEPQPVLTSMVVDAANHTATFTGRDADGNATTQLVHYAPGGVPSGVTAHAATDAAMAYLANQLAEFTWTPATRTLAFTPDASSPPSDIALSQLDTALQDLINGKANIADLDRLISNSNVVQGLSDFENSLRHETEIGTQTFRVATSNAFAVSTIDVPQWHPDDDLRVAVDGPDGTIESTIAASQLHARGGALQADLTNSNRIPTADGTEYVSFADNGGQFAVAASSPGNYVWTFYRTGTRIQTNAIGDGQVTEAKLAEAVRTKLNARLPSAGVTADQARAIADAEAAKYMENVDEVAHKNIRFSTAFAGRLAGEVGIADADLGFTASGTAYVAGGITRRNDGQIALTVTPIGSRADVRGYEFAVNGERHDFSAAALSAGDASNPDLYEFPAPSAAFSTTEDTRIAVLAPPTTFLPKGVAGQAGYVAKLNNALKPTWEKPTGGFKLLSGPGAGVAVVNHTASVHGNLQLFRPGGTGYFDLDIEDLDRFLFASLIWTLSGRSSTAIGFEPVANPPSSVFRPAVGVHLEELRDSTAYSRTSDNGYRVHAQPAWFGPRAVGHADGSNVLGMLEMWIAKEAATNYLGYWFKYAGSAAVSTGGQQYWNAGSTVRAYV